MALISVPTALDIYQASKLSPEHFETEETGSLIDEDIVTLIDAKILPDIINTTNATVDEAAAPLDFPFDAVILRAAYPSMSELAVTQWIAAQEGRFKSAMQYEAIGELLLRVRSLDDPYVKRAAMYKGWAKDKMKEGLSAIAKILAVRQAQTPELNATDSTPHSGSARPQFTW